MISLDWVFLFICDLDSRGTRVIGSAVLREYNTMQAAAVLQSS
ncbi:MAG TPA: hypothetical protein VFX22_10325 [Candidatus Kapabacteria bacterium]|nr:hypothetical protein [Candidatus Kapabacteria bacterium]